MLTNQILQSKKGSLLTGFTVPVQTYVVNTIATASFSTLSPNTNMYRTWSTFKALKMARVATGSTADINDPKAKLSTMSNSYTKPA